MGGKWEAILAQIFVVGGRFPPYPAMDLAAPVCRMMRPGEAHLREHYADLAARSFFPGLVS